MDPARQSTQPNLAYCTWCLGVVPFGQVRKRLICRRCGRVYRRIDPGASGRRRALRYMLYAAVSGAMPAASLAAAAALGPDHPLPAPREIATVVLAALVSLACLAHAIRLRLGASRFVSLAAWEIQDLERRLCPGMVRSDVIDELSRRGWTIGKIRSVLDGLRPDPSEAA
jgi:hypothetical protein